MVEIGISKISPFGASRGMEFQNFLQPWWRRVSVKLVILGASKGHVISNFLSMSKVSHSKRIMSESDLIWLKRAYWNLENGVKFYQKTLKTSLNLQEKTLKTLKIRVNQSVYTLYSHRDQSMYTTSYRSTFALRVADCRFHKRLM